MTSEANMGTKKAKTKVAKTGKAKATTGKKVFAKKLAQGKWQPSKMTPADALMFEDMRRRKNIWYRRSNIARMVLVVRMEQGIDDPPETAFAVADAMEAERAKHAPTDDDDDVFFGGFGADGLAEELLVACARRASTPVSATSTQNRRHAARFPKSRLRAMQARLMAKIVWEAAMRHLQIVEESKPADHVSKWKKVARKKGAAP